MRPITLFGHTWRRVVIVAVWIVSFWFAVPEAFAYCSNWEGVGHYSRLRCTCIVSSAAASAVAYLAAWVVAAFSD